eukprot:g755.t1
MSVLRDRAVGRDLSRSATSGKEDGGCCDIQLCETCIGALLADVNTEIEDCRFAISRYETFLADFKERTKNETKLAENNDDVPKSPSVTPPSNASARGPHLPSARNDSSKIVRDATENISNAATARSWRLIIDASELHNRHVELRDGLLQKLDHVNTNIKRMKHLNVLNESNFIWYAKHFGTISGFRLGSLPPHTIISAAEINAACGDLAMLLVSLACELDVRFSSCRVVEVGSGSYIVETGAVARRHDLFLRDAIGRDTRASSSGEGELYENVPSFNRAMRCACVCLGDLASEIESRTDRSAFGIFEDEDRARKKELDDDPKRIRRLPFTLPYSIEAGKVGGLSTDIPLNFSDSGMKRWTKAMRLLLTDAKFLLARAQGI